MRKQVLAGLAVASTLGFFIPLTSHAFGLGKIDVMSALNEPFKAEIALNALRSEERDNLQVRIASEDEFTKAGLNRSLLLSQLQFDIVQRNGQDKILVTSKQAIREPFLDFLLTATAGSGLLMREYTVLLDPPEYVMAATGTAPVRATEPTAQTRNSSSTDSTRYQYPDSQTPGSYRVKRSDTLWNIAMQTRPDSSVSVDQMMMALLEENPQAFTDRNVNGLNAGVTLQIPSRDAIQAMSQAQAKAAFKRQNEAWKNRNKPQNTTVTDVEPTTDSSNEQMTANAAEAADKPTSDSNTGNEVSSQTADANNDGHLQLVAPEEEADSEDDAKPNVEGQDEIDKLTEQLTLAQETLEIQAQENLDFKSRMDAMDEQLETMRRLLSLKDADLARLQALLQEDDPELAAQAAAILEKDKSDVDGSMTEPMINDSLTPEATPGAVAENTAADENAGSSMNAANQQNNDDVSVASEQAEAAENTAPVTDAGDNSDDMVNKAANALNLDKSQVESSVSTVKQFAADNKLPLALALLLLLLVLWLLIRRNNREVTWDEAVRKMDKNPGPAAAAVPLEEEEMTDAPLADEQVEEQKSVPELVEQADMFVGYADYVQARTALEQARVIEPENTLVAYKLLFVLYKQNEAESFVEIADSTPFDQDSLEWEEIQQWGRQLMPGHALFAASAEEEAEPVEAEVEVEPVTFEPDPDQPDQQDKEDTATASSLDIETVETDDRAHDHIEFDLSDFDSTTEEREAEAHQEPSEETPEPAPEQDDEMLSFDTSYAQAEETADSEDEPLELDITEDLASNDSDDLSFEFENEATEPEQDFSDADELLSVDSSDTPDLNFDLEDLDDIDEAETKLDLAAAYIDMGDPDGARSILNEVLVDGNDEQKERAQELLNAVN
jgi:pilus assembly protein FimV